MACSVKEEDVEERVKPENEQGVEQNGGFKLVFKAAPFTSGDVDSDTKTYVEPNGDYSNYEFKWSQKDTVGIYPDTGNQVFFTMAGGAGSGSAEFDGGAWTCKEGHEYRSYFPFVGDIYLDATKIPVSFTGQKQVGNANSDHFQKYDYMYTPAVTKGEGNLTFSYYHLITAVLPWVELPGGHYTGITLSLDEPLFVTEGEYDLTAASPAIDNKAYSNTMHVELDVVFTTPDILKVFIPLAPMNMSGKTLTITVTDEEDRTYVYTYTPSKQYVAGKIYRLRSATSFADTPITFADPAVKAICVARWDTNNDGELSFSEAAAVTTIPYAAFAENTTITSFDEFQYFTGVTEMQYDFDYDEGMDYYGTFFECTSLKSITLPPTLTKISFGCFRGCSALEKIIIPASVNVIEQVAFLGCTNLYVYMESETPCTLQKDFYNTYDEPYVFGFLSSGRVKRIYVPTEASVAVYQAAQYWSTYSFRIYYLGIQVTGIQLNETVLNMRVGGTAFLTANVLPDNATYTSISWSSSNPAIATVSSSGEVTAVAEGSATITASATDGSGCTATCEVTVTPGLAIPEAVDLGLSVKWASFNLGASAPEEYGDYFAWGEVAPNSELTWETYVWCNGTGNSLTKYNTNSSSGTVDNKIVLDREDDAAFFILGSGWRMPTQEEWTELRENCTSAWTDNYEGTGVAGTIVTSNLIGYTDNSIFLPAAGRQEDATINFAGSSCLYWSSSSIASLSGTAWNWSFNTDHWNCYSLPYCYGSSVRPVYETLLPETLVPVTGLALSQTSASIGVGTSSRLAATITPANAFDKCIIWNSSNTSIATVRQGQVTAVALGTATITATTVDGGFTASCLVTVTPVVSVPEAVDLGLSVKWASFNLGASAPEEYGDHYAWGETAPKSDYSWTNYKWYNFSSSTLTKYNTNSSYGTVDNKTILDPADDAAHFNLGDSWRMPTDAECNELIDNCTWIWTTINGVNGMMVTSNKSGYTDRWIFLPAAGGQIGTHLDHVGSGCRLWSSSLFTGYMGPAWYMGFSSELRSVNYDSDRYEGLSVRPVTD